MNNPIIDRWGNKIWHNEYGEYHREDGPAVEYTNGDKFWYIHGKRHRDNGPAIEYASGYVQFWINNSFYNSLEEGLMDQALE